MSEAVLANALGFLDMAAAVDLARVDDGRPLAPHHLRHVVGPSRPNGRRWAGVQPRGVRDLIRPVRRGW